MWIRKLSIATSFNKIDPGKSSHTRIVTFYDRKFFRQIFFRFTYVCSHAHTQNKFVPQAAFAVLTKNFSLKCANASWEAKSCVMCVHSCDMYICVHTRERFNLSYCNFQKSYLTITIFKNHHLGVKFNNSKTVYHKNIKPVPLDKICTKTNLPLLNLPSGGLHWFFSFF